MRRRSASPGHFTLRADADATDKYFTRVDFTEEFPFLVSKTTPYCDDSPLNPKESTDDTSKLQCRTVA